MNPESDKELLREAPRTTAKVLARNALLLLVAGSLAYLLVKEMGDRSSTHPAASPGALPDTITEKTRLIVYYFAEGKDCATCENLPVFTKEALDKGFGSQLESREIVWAPINVDEKRNEHFVTEYQIYTKSVVLVRVEHGGVVRWKNLDAIWDLVYDKTVFMKYIQDQTHAFLDAAS